MTGFKQLIHSFFAADERRFNRFFMNDLSKKNQRYLRSSAANLFS